MQKLFRHWLIPSIILVNQLSQSDILIPPFSANIRTDELIIKIWKSGMLNLIFQGTFIVDLYNATSVDFRFKSLNEG